MTAGSENKSLASEPSSSVKEGHFEKQEGGRSASE